MALKYQIIPSIISRKPTEYQKIVRILEKYADMIQFDIMDGKFVPGKTFDHKTVGQIRTKAHKEVHLMVKSPLKSIDKYITAGADMIIVHIESEQRKENLVECALLAKKSKIGFGLALSPQTPVSKAKPYMRYCDKILIMTRPPGKVPRPFDPRTLIKIRQLRNMKSMAGKDIEVDGSIDAITIDYCAKAGANHFVVGSALFRDRMPRCQRGKKEECLRKSIRENFRELADALNR